MRALQGPAPFLGSGAVAISRDGRNVYVASSRSDAIAVFRRGPRTGKLTQRSGAAGCIAARGASGCATARGLNGPNSVAVSADGKNVYATSLISDAVAIFRRNRSTGALTQARGGNGCIANRATPGCTTGRALDGPDVVTVSPDGENVYVGAFFGDASGSSTTSVASRQSRIAGEVVLPGSPNYEVVRKPAMARFDEVRPQAIVRCQGAADVAEALGLVRRAGTEVAGRGGGHCFAGRSSTGGVLLDAGPMSAVSVGDATVTVGGGAYPNFPDPDPDAWDRVFHGATSIASWG